MGLTVVVVLFGCSVLPVSSVSVDSEHIFTVCSGLSVTHSRRGDAIPPCNHLSPVGADFFGSATNTRNFSVDECRANYQTEGDEVVERNLGILKRGVDVFRHHLRNFVDVLQHYLLSQSIPLNTVAIGWDWRVYLSICSVISVLFHLHSLFDVDVTSYLVSIILGFGTGSVYYSIHLFYDDTRLLLVYMFIGFISTSPLYGKCRLRSISCVTWLHLLMPLSALWLYNAFETRLFFGPILSCILNGILMLLHLLCLIILYVDERLTIVKLILMPFYRIFQDAIMGNQAALTFFEPVHRRTSRLVIGLLETLNESTVNDRLDGELSDQMGYQLGVRLSKKLELLCRRSAEMWTAQCPLLLHRSCLNYFQYRPIGSLDTFTNQFGALFESIPGLGHPFGRSTNQMSPRCDLCERMCQMVVVTSCGSVNFSEQCRPDVHVSRFISEYRSLISSLQHLHSSLSTKSTLPLLGSFFSDGDPLNFFHEMVKEDIVLLLRYSIGVFASFFSTALVLYAVTSSYRFLNKYRNDPLFFKVYLDGEITQNRAVSLSKNERKRYTPTWTNVIGVQMKMMFMDQSALADSAQLLFQVVLAFCVERIGRLVHEKVHQLLNFSVPAYGDANFAFRVQGNGTVAAVIRSVLGGFNVHSHYCDIATTNACVTPFISVKWFTWVILWFTASVYFIACLFKRRSGQKIALDSIWMALVCDWLLPQQSRKREAALLQQIQQDRRKRMIITQQLAQEALTRMQSRDGCNRLAYHLRHYLPGCIANWMNIGRIYCEVCCLDVAVACFPCRSLLFCQECSLHLITCPSHHKI